ncbi:prolipoprotein diacylglyceryl transferase [Nibrella viscosa]|uniref:Phosphatidylglycerol--prolipoprotein diacylglyceryl transferase n=1 Tax=Nibrella viscosa TaxID=1084524 RepID=A0ABP8KDW1_9BACT
MLQYIIWDVDPEIFHVGSFSVRWYGLLFALGFLIGMQIMVRIFKTEGKPVEDTDTLLLYMVITTVLGARIGHFLFYEPEFLLKNPLQVLLPPYSGLASHGAGIGIITGLWIYSRRATSRKTGQTFLWVLDRIAIVVALAGSFIRFGNLMNSEIIGRPTNLPWGFVFVRARDEFPIFTDSAFSSTLKANPARFEEVITSIKNGTVNLDYMLVSRHPAQLYESISSLILFLILLGLWNRYKARTPRGLLFGLFMVWIFTLRFLYEFLKENQEAFENTMVLNMGQILSIPAVLLGLFFLIRSFRSHPQVNSSVPQE